jgi:hypothetical protein
LVAGGANAIARLIKREVEALLAAYDDDPVDALTTALRIVLELPDALWPELVLAAGFTQTRAAALLVGDQRSLDGLASELNEARTVRRDGRVD